VAPVPAKGTYLGTTNQCEVFNDERAALPTGITPAMRPAVVSVDLDLSSGAGTSGFAYTKCTLLTALR
jgi:hypothetical protein